MKITSLSGKMETLGLGRRNGVELAAGASITVDDDPETVADAVKLADQGIIRIDEPPQSAQLTFQPGVPGQAVVTVGAPADGETLVIGNQTFEIDDDDTANADNVAVDISGSSDSIDVATALQTAINANVALDALGIKARDVVGGTDETAEAFVVVTFPSSIEAESYTVTGDTGLVVATTNATSAQALKTAVLRQAAAGDEEILVTPFASVVDYFVMLQTAAGAYKAYNGTVKSGGGSIFLNSSGDADIAATDEIVILVVGF